MPLTDAQRLAEVFHPDLGEQRRAAERQRYAEKAKDPVWREVRNARNRRNRKKKADPMPRPRHMIDEPRASRKAPLPSRGPGCAPPAADPRPRFMHTVFPPVRAYLYIEQGVDPAALIRSGEATFDDLICGRPPAPGKPYCEEHDRLTHTPVGGQIQVQRFTDAGGGA